MTGMFSGNKVWVQILDNIPYGTLGETEPSQKYTLRCQYFILLFYDSSSPYAQVWGGSCKAEKQAS